jgi:hypothetical protein
MFTRILAIFAPVIFLFFTACSGDSNPPPPNPVPNPQAVDSQMLNNLYDHAQKAKASCTQDYTPVFIQLAAAYLSAPRPSCGGGAIPGNPNGPVAGAPVIAPFEPFSYASAAQVAGAARQPASACGAAAMPALPQVQQPAGSCNNDLMNLIMTFTTIKLSNGTLYANLPEAQQWLAQTMGGILSRVGGNIQGAGINLAQNPQLQQFLLGTAANQVQNVVIPGLGGYAGQAGQLFNQFAPPIPRM